jgi:hypothetical protein
MGKEIAYAAVPQRHRLCSVQIVWEQKSMACSADRLSEARSVVSRAHGAGLMLMLTMKGKKFELESR